MTQVTTICSVFNMKIEETKPYPKNFEEFLDWFSTEEQCLDYLERIRWPDGFGSYQTAWGWLAKYRSVMIRKGRERLNGRVEIDEAFIGGQIEDTGCYQTGG